MIMNITGITDIEYFTLDTESVVMSCKSKVSMCIYSLFTFPFIASWLASVMLANPSVFIYFKRFSVP